MLPHQRFNEPVPVINEVTGETLGEAVPATIVGAHLQRNSRPFINFAGRNQVCVFDVDNPNKIVVSDDSIDFY